MNKQEFQHVRKIIEAFEAGKTIQWYSEYHKEWRDCITKDQQESKWYADLTVNDSDLYNKPMKFRIKPEAIKVYYCLLRKKETLEFYTSSVYNNETQLQDYVKEMNKLGYEVVETYFKEIETN